MQIAYKSLGLKKSDVNEEDGPQGIMLQILGRDLDAAKAWTAAIYTNPDIEVAVPAMMKVIEQLDVTVLQELLQTFQKTYLDGLEAFKHWLWQALNLGCDEPALKAPTSYGKTHVKMDDRVPMQYNVYISKRKICQHAFYYNPGACYGEQIYDLFWCMSHEAWHARQTFLVVKMMQLAEKKRLPISTNVAEMPRVMLYYINQLAYCEPEDGSGHYYTQLVEAEAEAFAERMCQHLEALTEQAADPKKMFRQLHAETFMRTNSMVPPFTSIESVSGRSICTWDFSKARL